MEYGHFKEENFSKRHIGLNEEDKRNILKKLGPGLLFAGTAIGVSHLVQSTKAGAEFGFGLTWALFLAIILKYPFFKYAPKYSLVTNESVLHGY